jgi:hypothetical protein
MAARNRRTKNEYNLETEDDARTDSLFGERLRIIEDGARESSMDFEQDLNTCSASRNREGAGLEQPPQVRTRLFQNVHPSREQSWKVFERVAASTNEMTRLQTGAALGACREQCRDLEWRLQTAEETIHRQTQELTNLRMHNASQAQQERIEGQLRRIEKLKEVDSILLRHERRRAAFSPISSARLLSPPRLGQRLGSSSSLKDFGSPPRLERSLVSRDPIFSQKASDFPSDSDEAFLRYMADFQLETDRLRARLGIPSS